MLKFVLFKSSYSFILCVLWVSIFASYNVEMLGIIVHPVVELRAVDISVCTGFSCNPIVSPPPVRSGFQWVISTIYLCLSIEHMDDLVIVKSTVVGCVSKFELSISVFSIPAKLLILSLQFECGGGSYESNRSEFHILGFVFFVFIINSKPSP